MSNSKLFLIVVLIFLSANYSKAFKIERVIDSPKCIANVSLAGITQYGTIKKEELLKQKEIYMKWEGDCVEYKKAFVKILSFEIRTMINGNSVSLASGSAQFTPSQKNIFKKVKSGTFINFEQIKVQAINGVRGMESFYVKVE